MKLSRRIRCAGLSCMTGAVVWVAALVIEYRYGLFPPGSGTLFVVNQTMFGVAMLGYLLGILGLVWGKVAHGWFGKIMLGLFLAGWCAIFLSLVSSLLTGSTMLEILAPLGGILGNFSALLAGIAIAVEGRWHGWQRFAVLLYGLYFLLVLFLPIVIADQEPTFITETGWSVAWLLIGAAVYTSTRATPAMHTVLNTVNTEGARS